MCNVKGVAYIDKATNIYHSGAPFAFTESVCLFSSLVWFSSLIAVSHISAKRAKIVVLLIAFFFTFLLQIFYCIIFYLYLNYLICSMSFYFIYMFSFLLYLLSCTKTPHGNLLKKQILILKYL